MDWSPLFISIKTAVLATTITFFLGIYAAHKVIRVDKKISLLLDGLLTLPLVLPPTVAGFILLMLFGKRGILGKLLMSIGIEIIFTWVAAVIAATVVAFPLMYRSAKASFEQIDKELIDVGRTLGMSEIMIFWKVIIPLSMPGIISGGILAFARALGEFGATIMIAGNIPKITQTMPLAIYMGIQGGKMEEAVIWVGMMIVISMIVIFLMNFFAAKGG